MADDFSEYIVKKPPPAQAAAEAEDEFEKYKRVSSELDALGATPTALPQGPSALPPQAQPLNLQRMGYEALGGWMGGTLASPGVVTTPLGIGIGAAAGGQLYDWAWGKPKPLPEQMLQAASDVGINALAPAASAKLLTGAKKIGNFGLDKIRSKLTGNEPPPFDYGFYSQYGVKPDLATMYPNKLQFAQARNALSDYFFSANPMIKSARSNLDALKETSKYLAQQYGDVLTNEDVSKLLVVGSKKSIDRLKGTYNKIYTALGQKIGNGLQGVDNTANLFEQLAQEQVSGPKTGVFELAEQILKKAEDTGGGLPFESLKNWRTYVGEMLTQPGLLTTRNIATKDLKRLGQALTDDMAIAAKKAGAEADWKAADHYFKTTMEETVPYLEEIVKKGLDDTAFNILMSKSKYGATRLRAMRRELAPEEWDAIAATQIAKMGRAKPSVQDWTEDVFSPATFLTNWANLSKEAKQTLFAGGRYKDLYHSLEDLVKLTSNVKKVEAIANKSKTGSVLMFFSMFQTIGATGAFMAQGAHGAASGAALMGSMVMAPNLVAKLITNEKFVKWMAQGLKIAETSPNSMAGHIGRLFALREEPDIKEGIDTILNQMNITQLRSGT